MIERNPDWQKSLMTFIQALPSLPMQYGQHDCALFAAEAVRVMTGQDIAAPYRGRYTSLRGGLRILAKDGFADQVELARAHLPSVAVCAAMPGDIAVIRGEPLRALGVVQGGAVYVLADGGGLGLVPLTDAIEVFKV